MNFNPLSKQQAMVQMCPHLSLLRLIQTLVETLFRLVKFILIMFRLIQTVFQKADLDRAQTASNPLRSR